MIRDSDRNAEKFVNERSGTEKFPREGDPAPPLCSGAGSKVNPSNGVFELSHQQNHSLSKFF